MVEQNMQLDQYGFDSNRNYSSNDLSYQLFDLRYLSIIFLKMGSNLCSSNVQEMKLDIFNYVYCEDNKEIKIIHNDSIETNLQSIRISLLDCQTKLKRSEKRFKDLTINSQPIVLVCGQKEMHCTFQRPQVFLKPEATLSYKIYRVLDAQNCKPENIVVGDQAMQYFGVFLCYLSKNPQLIDRIILTHKNSYGIAAIQVIYDGRREVLFIDDYVLCHNKKPLFSKPVKYTDMWPCLLEKAWFKIKSFFKSKITEVNPFEVFTTFLSYPVKRYSLTDFAKYNQTLVARHIINFQASGRGFGCVITSKVRPNHKIGLSGSKHFYLLKVLQFKEKKYFYIRNPCGQFDFRGSLHELPQQLYNQIVRVTGEHPTLGNFILTQQEFEQQIQSFFTIQYNPSSPIANQEQIFFTNNYNAENYIKFKITKKGEVSIRLQQLISTQQFVPLTYLLVDVDRKCIISGLLNNQGCFGIHETSILFHNEDLLDNLYQTLQPGTYFLRLKKKSQNKTNIGRTRDRLIMSANENIKFEISESGQLKNDFLFTIKEIVKKKLSEDKNTDRGEIEHKVVWLGDLVVIYINKLNTGKEAINMEVNFPDLTNLQCLSHNINRGYTSLPPFPKDMLIVFQKISLTESTSVGKYNLTPY